MHVEVLVPDELEGFTRANVEDAAGFQQATLLRRRELPERFAFEDPIITEPRSRCRRCLWRTWLAVRSLFALFTRLL